MYPTTKDQWRWGSALAAEAVGLDGLVLTMGDMPKSGEPIKMLKSSGGPNELRRFDPELLTFYDINTLEDFKRATEILRYRSIGRYIERKRIP